MTTPNETLFNDTLDLFDTEVRAELFEQYLMFVESAEKVSDRRASANAFFVSLNTLLVSVIGYFSSRSDETHTAVLMFSCSGMLISMLWYRIIFSYKQLNSAKFEIIQAIEKELPVQLFQQEWQALTKTSDQRYRTLTQTEKFVPVVFGLLYFGWLAYHLFPQ